MTDRNEAGFSLDDLLGAAEPAAFELEPEPEPAEETPRADEDRAVSGGRASGEEAEALLRAMGLLADDPVPAEAAAVEPETVSDEPQRADLGMLLGIDLDGELELEPAPAPGATAPQPETVEEEPPRPSVRSRFADAPAFQAVREDVPAAATEPEPESQPKPQVEQPPKPELEPVEQSKPEPEPERVPEQPIKLLPAPSKPTVPQPAPAATLEPKPEVKSESKPAAKPAPAPKPKPAPASEPVPAPKPEAKPGPELVRTPDPAPHPQAAPEPALREFADAPAPAVSAPNPLRPFTMPEERDDAQAKRTRGGALWYVAGTVLLILAAACTCYAVYAGSASADPALSGVTPQTQAAAQGSSAVTFKYTVRGPEGALCEATERAEFDAEGVLDCSTIAIEASTDEEAEALLEHAREQFGSTWVGGSVEKGQAVFTIDAERDGIDREAYTSLLMSNTTDCTVVDPAA